MLSNHKNRRHAHNDPPPAAPPSAPPEAASAATTGSSHGRESKVRSWLILGSLIWHRNDILLVQGICLQVLQGYILINGERGGGGAAG